MSEKIKLHDPRGYPPKVVGKQLAPRLQTLDGKVVCLVDCLFDNSAIFCNLFNFFLKNKHLAKSSESQQLLPNTVNP